MKPSSGGKVEQAGDSESLELLARVGLIAYGVVHLLISWLGVAWRRSAGRSAASGRVLGFVECL